jgi:hypothetical protein
MGMTSCGTMLIVAAPFRRCFIVRSEACMREGEALRCRLASSQHRTTKASSYTSSMKDAKQSLLLE